MKVTPQERMRLASAPRVRPQAYEAYLKSRYFLTIRSLEGARKSLEYARKSVVLQPDSALFEAGLADSLISMSLLYAAAPRDVLPQAKAAAERALQMDDSLAQGHDALANSRNTRASASADRPTSMPKRAASRRSSPRWQLSATAASRR